MSNWKKIIVSGSQAHLSSVTASNGSIISGSLTMSGSITNVTNLDFNTTPPQSLSSTIEGRLSWDNGTRDLIVGAGNDVDIHVGQQEWTYVYNAEATTLNKGEIVYISGSQGNTIAVKRASDSGDPTSAGTLGMVGESISSGAEGLVLVNGLMRKLNTSTLTAGKLLYLSSTPGAYTETIPTPPSHSVRIGYVAKVDATQGEIYVKIDNGYEIGELHDIVDGTTTTSYGDLLVKSGSVWKNSKQLTGSYGLTGSLQATSFTGSLQGTASNSVSSSYAVTSSFASSSPAVYDFGSFATPTDVGGGGNFGIVTDGDKGDITVTSSGSIWTIDNDAVTYAKIQNVTTSSVLLGRATTGAGNIEEIILGSGLTISGSTISAAGGGGSAPQVQVDTITSSQTWTPPVWGKYFKVILFGGGSGGGSGARQATTTARSGGGGGAGASAVIVEYTNLQITGSVSVTIGSGGSGGTSITADNTNGNNGSVGGVTSFGSLISTYSQSGQGGFGGTTSSGTNGQGISTISLYSYGNIYTNARSGRTTTGDSRIFTNENTFALGGGCGGAGGGGAGASSTTTANGGTFDLWSAWLPISASSGGTNGGNGNDGVSFIYGYLTLGTPGGGGSYKTGQATGRGGDASYGAGGGGGAASDNGFASGRGGNGGNGICIIVSIG